ncbi:cation transport ATPase [Thalassiosira pseudonana CCMP1335]|uniref:P-type sodium-transporting ATPase4 n=1 Tax=Thalassiosira pseudonana TaxID=35128 RepID=B8BRF4_THAPS|nr:cation transport ATPase [Thalassiosira pseudonana CCMP1335]EED96531.1 cation transport ATPase [Thalassiosira pseudonana CCMP1335]
MPARKNLSRSSSTVEIDELCAYYGVDLSKGLSTAEVEAKREEFGWNELDKEESTPLWKLVLEQFDDTLVKILLAAAAVSFALAFFDDSGSHSDEEGILAYVEPIVILIILILNAMVGVWQESNAEAALEALKELQSETARVLRDGKMATINSREIVPGDIIEVKVGDRVPADTRVTELKTTSLRIDQSQLTGESQSVAKFPEVPNVGEDELVVQAKTNIMFATTTVVGGIARGIVTDIGMKTEIGKIQLAVQGAAEDEEDTPLKKKLDEFGDMLSQVIGVICLLVWAINYNHFFDPVHGSVFNGCIYYFKIAVALAVAAIPEGLPTVITTCLALGTRKMAAKNAIVRKLPSVETLGCTNVICSDKTGTLTTNEMSCVEVVLPEGKNEMTTRVVSGITYAPTGEISPPVDFVKSSAQLSMLSSIASLCNASSIEYDTKGKKYVRVGEPTEASLKVLVEKMGKATVLATLEFHRDRKSMSVISKPAGSKTNQLLVKGAPEGLISRCNKIMLGNGKVVSLDKDGVNAILNQQQRMAGRALRVLALAYKDLSGDLGSYDGTREHKATAILSQDTSTFSSIESELTFVGLVGIIDPPREEIAPMVKICKTAGIRIMMITGDNKLTAEAIAVDIGILDKGFDADSSFTGSDFFKKSDSEQLQILMKDNGGLVFSRTEPRHKQQLVKLLKSQGCVVAMTGDGVNDAPALKQADIGIAMGLTGTEVAKEASDMILADDNFATIVHAVEEGRSIYNNMQAFIRYLISSNIGEVAAIFFTAALGMPEGLIPVQLLWVNLVTDGPPATALGFNPADKDIMKKLPRRADDNLITPWVFFRYMVVGIYVGFACVGVFAYWYMYYESDHTNISWEQLTGWGHCSTWTDFKVNDFDGLDMQTDPCKYFTDGKVKASTMSLSVLVAIEMFNALNALSEDGSLVTMPPWSNPYLLLAMVVSFGMHFVILYVDFLADMFNVTPLDWDEWKVVLAFSLPVIFIDEILKFVGRKMSEKELKQRMSGELNGAKKNQ